jgi:hypothetical protein
VQSETDDEESDGDEEPKLMSTAEYVKLLEQDAEIIAILNEEEEALIGHFHGSAAEDKPASTHRKSHLFDSITFAASINSMQERCVLELQKVLGCPTMGHPWAMVGNIKELIDVTLHACSAGKGDEKIRLNSFRLCLHELALQYEDLLTRDSIARGEECVESKSVSATDTPLSHRLCTRLLEGMEHGKSHDSLALRVMLCWCLGRHDDARRLLLGAVMAVFESVPHSADFSDLTEAPVIRRARQAFVLCIAANMHLLLTINASPNTRCFLVSSCHMSLGLISVISIAIRTALMFGCIDHRYDIIYKLLRHPPKFRLGAGESDSSDKSYSVSASEPPVTPSKHTSSGGVVGDTGRPKDLGYMYLKRVSRAEAISILQPQKPGAFLVRPHDTQSEVLFLSFLSGPEEGVKHAIVRRELFTPERGSEDEIAYDTPDSAARHHKYRCGKIGPCRTLDETLRSISLILPCRLIFDLDGTDGPTDKVGVSDQIGASDASSQAASEPADGGFVTAITDATCNLTFCPATSLVALSWDPNAEFWWEAVHESKEAALKVDVPKASLLAELSRPASDVVAPHVSSPDDAPIEDQAEVHETADLGDDEDAAPTYVSSSADHGGDGITVSLTRRETRKDNEDRQWARALPEDDLGCLVRGVVQLLTVKTLYKQITGQIDGIRKVLSSEKIIDHELRVLIRSKLAARLPQTLLPSLHPDEPENRESSIPAATSDVSKHPFIRDTSLCSVDYLLFPLAIFGCVSERAMMATMCPPLPMDPATLTPSRLQSGEALVRAMMSETDGVQMRIVHIPHSALSSHLGFTVAHSANAVANTSSQDQVVECFELEDGLKWFASHSDLDAVNAVGCCISSANAKIDPNPVIPDAQTMIKWLWKKGFLQNIVIGADSGSSGANSQIFYRYVDPWEVSVVSDQTAVMTSCRLGRLWLGPVSTLGSRSLLNSVCSYLRDMRDHEITAGDMGGFYSSAGGPAGSSSSSSGVSDRDKGDYGFMKLWDTLRAEAWLVMCVSSATEQSERENGGPVTTIDTNMTGLSRTDPYHTCIARYLYRNALFKRLRLPHRFVAMIQIDTFVLKDLAPHKFRAGVVSAPIEVYGVLRLVRSSEPGGVKKTDALRKGSCDIIITPPRRAETARSASTSQPSEYLWREQAVIRFPLPESVLLVDPFAEGDDRNLRQPPRKLQLSVYETRSLFGDQKLGDLELPLSALTDDAPFREWLPLTSEKGSAWFIRIQLQLRFLLMAHDLDREADPESSTIRSKKGRNKVKVSKEKVVC